MMTKKTNHKTSAPILLLLSLLIAGCSDRLAPPTGADPIAERSIAFSWLIDGDPRVELARSATISSRGRDRAEMPIEGVLLAVRNGRMVVARVDTFNGYDTLMYGPLDGSTPLALVAAETSDIMIDFATVTLSDDGTKLAYYSSEYYRVMLNLVDVALAVPLTPNRIDMNWTIAELYLPPPDFSPDGDSVAYIGYDPVFGTTNLSVTSISNPVESVLVPDLMVNGSTALVDWSPDGEKILFAGFNLDGTGAHGIYSISRNGGGFDPPEIMVLASDFEQVATPAWAPDGKTFAYATTSGFGAVTIHTVNTETGAGATLVTTGGSIFDLAWSKDGSQLLYNEAKEQMPLPDVMIYGGILHTLDVAAKRAIPIATDVVKGFWLE